MNTLQRAYLVAIALLTCMTLFSCSEQTTGSQGRKGTEQAAQGQPRAPEGKPGAKSENGFDAKPRIVPKKKIVEDDVKVYYAAEASGDYGYTYEHLSEADRLTFRACYEPGQKPHRNAASTVALVPVRSPFPAFLRHF